MPFVAPFCHLDEGEILYAMPLTMLELLYSV